MCFKQEDNHPGCSQQGSSFDVRLQSAPRRITTRKGRRQAGDDEVRQLSHSWFRSESKSQTIAVCLLPGTEVAFETEVECEHVFKVFRSQKLISEKVSSVPADQSGAAQRASRRVGIPQRKDHSARPAARRPARDRAAVAGFSARHERSGAAEARFSRYLIGPLAIELAWLSKR